MDKILQNLIEKYNQLDKRQKFNKIVEYIQTIPELTTFMKDNNITTVDVIWFIVHNEPIEPRYCLHCGKQIHAKSYFKTYSFPKCCCITCLNHSDYHKQKIQNTKANWTEEQKQAISKKSTETNNRRWSNMTPEKLAKRLAKTEETCLRKFGVKNYSSCDEGKQKHKERIKAYYENVDVSIIQQRVAKMLHTKEQKTEEEKRLINEKRSKTLKEKAAKRTKEEKLKMREKRIKTCIDKYGTPFPLSNKEIRYKSIKTKIKNGTIFRSRKETELYNALKQIFPALEHNRWNVLYDTTCKSCRELDILLRSKKLGIEFNGTYWHQNDPDSSDKQQLCENIGWRLLVVKEEDWDRDKENEIKRCIEFLSN